MRRRLAPVGGRGYQEAIEMVNSLLTPGAGPRLRGEQHPRRRHREFMEAGFAKLGIDEAQLCALRVVHVAGTKGKGSTAAMCESIFRESGLRTGMFTSPHILDVTERIQVAGQPLARAQFAKYFWEVVEALECDDKAAADDVHRASFFRLLTLIAIHTFRSEGLDVAILEVGMGGRWDATNAIDHPAVCGISHVGYDHVDVLGDTLTLIAEQKAGISKPATPFLIAPNQDPEAQAQLEATARACGAYVATCPPFDALPDAASVALGLAGAHQRDNAALAVSLCRTWLERAEGVAPQDTSVVAGRPPAPLPPAFVRGLEACRWAGRCQTVTLAGGRLRLLIDGAHTTHSVRAAYAWFSEEAGGESSDVERHLLFHCQHGRVPAQLLEECCGKTAFDAAHFVPLQSSKESLFAAGAKVCNPETVLWVEKQKEAWDGLVCVQHPEVRAYTHTHTGHILSEHRLPLSRCLP